MITEDHILHLEAVEPTLFFRRTLQGLQQAVDLVIHNANQPIRAIVAVRLGSRELQADIGLVQSGRGTYRIYVPDIRQPVPAEFVLSVQGGEQVRHSMAWVPQRHWTVYMVHYSHHDLGYTDLPTDVLREHDGFLDDVLRFCQETDDWPEESRFRYLIEQAWSVVHFIENRPQEIVDELVHYMREGRIEVTALFGNQTSELCGHEELIRLMYPAFRLKREYGVPICSAEHNDIPGMSWGLATVLTGAGVKLFSPGIPRWYFGLGEERVHSLWDESAVLPLDIPGAFRWEGPDGGRVLFWYDMHGHGEWHPWSYQQALHQLPDMLNTLEKRGYPYDLVTFTQRGGYRDNAPPSIRFSHIARKWNSRWAYPRLITATNAQFLEHLERDCGNLPTFRGEVPGTDYTVAATCTAKETALDRNTHDQLLSAEKFAAVATAVADCLGSSDYPYPREALDEAYKNTFYYDLHCWGMAHVVGPAQDGCWSEKRRFAYRAAALTHNVLSKVLNRIVDQVALSEEGYHCIVFNPLSWRRTDVVRVPLRTPAPCARPMYLRYPEGLDGDQIPELVSGTAIGRDIVDPPLSLIESPFDLVDGDTGEKVPCQVVTLSDPRAPTPWAAERYALGHVDPAHLKEIIFVAHDVPPMGYKTYRIVPAKEWADVASTVQVNDTTIENQFFKVSLAPHTGVIVSIYDKELGREIVDIDASQGVNQFIARWAETGEEESPLQSTIVVGELGPIYGSLVVTGEGTGCPQRTQEVILYDGIKRIDLANRLLRDSTPLLEVYFAFPFQVDDPQFRFEGCNSVIEPLRDQFPGSNTDAYALQHWADVFNGEGGVVWSSVDAPIVEFGGLWPGYVSYAHHGVTPPGFGHEFLRSGELSRAHIYSYVMDNNFRTNFLNVQVSDVLFRYSLTTHRGDWREGRARDFGWSVHNPLIPVCMKGPKGGNLPRKASFCQVDQPHVMLLTLKRSEDGDGTIVRLIETEGREATVTVTLPFQTISRAYETNLVEENQRLLSSTRHTVKVPVRSFGIATLRLQTQ